MSLEAPYFGFATSPLVAGELLIVETGNKNGRAITAVDRATGKTRWSHGDDEADYESPILVELASQKQLVVATHGLLFGLDPATGHELWHHEHGLNGVLGTPTPTDAIGIMLRSMDEVVVFDIAGSRESVRVGERWRSSVFKQSFLLPVVQAGYAYGMSRSFLTCVDTRDGRLVWRSRPPGGNGLALVDGYLAMLAKGGELVVAKASPSGYEEVARSAVLDPGSYAAPSFAAGHFFVRDLASLAAIRITEGAATRPKALDLDPVDPDRYLGAFGALLETIARLPAAERQKRIDAELENRKDGPITEVMGNEGFAHLIYQGSAKDVAVIGNLPGASNELPLHQLLGTDLFFRSFRLDPSGIWQYQLNIDLGDPGADPGNPRAMPVRGAEWSILSMPKARKAPHLDRLPTETPLGRIESFTLSSELRNGERQIDVYLPAGYEASAEKRYPLLLFTRRGLRGRLAFDHTLDFLIANGAIEPLVVAFVERNSANDHSSEAAAFVTMLTEELLPQLESRFRLVTDRQQRALAGLLGGAGIAVYAGLEAQEIFGKVAAQSFLGQGIEGIYEPRTAKGLEVYLEMRSDDDEDDNESVAVATKAIEKALRAGGARVRVVEDTGGGGLAGWRTTLDQMLIALFGRHP